MLVVFPCSGVTRMYMYGTDTKQQCISCTAQLWQSLQFLIRQVRSDIGAVLRVLLVLRVEVVERVSHYVLGVHGLLQAAGDGLHGDGAVRVAVRVRVHGGREGVAQRHGRRQHLDADEEVLVAGRHRAGRRGHVVRVRDRHYYFGLLQDGQGDALPEREEDDGLDGEELEHGVERLEHLTGGTEEQEQPVERQTDGEVVHDRDVQVAAVGAPVAVMVVPCRLQEYNNEGADRLDETELQGGLLAEAQEANGVGGAGEAARAVDAGGAHGPASQLGHDVALASQVLVAQGQEAVDHERFIAVPDCEEVHVVGVSVEE